MPEPGVYGLPRTPSSDNSPSTTVATDPIWDAKGDLAVGTGADAAARLAAGVDGLVLTADAASENGMKWEKTLPMTTAGDLVVGNVGGLSIAEYEDGATAGSASDWSYSAVYGPLRHDAAANLRDGYEIRGNYGFALTPYVVTLPVGKTVGSIRLGNATDPNYRATSIKIEISTNGTDWTTLVANQPINSNDYTFSITPTYSRYWRFWALAIQNASWWMFSVLRLYDADAGKPIRLPIGSDNQVLRVATDAPAWEDEFDATAPSTQAFGDAAVVGTATTAAHRDHKHAMPAVPALDDLSDINAPTPTDNDVLAWDSGTSKWINAAPPSGGIQATLIDAKGDLIAGSAADTAARLAVGADGYVLTSNSAEATGLKWAAVGGAAAAEFIGASATLTTQTVPNSAWTELDFSTAEQFDTAGFHSISTNPSRMTIPAGFGGKYLVTTDILWDSDVSFAGSRYTKFIVNGSTPPGEYNWRTDGGAASTDMGHQRMAVLDLVAGDYVQVSVYQDRGGNLDIQGGKLQIVKLDSGTVGRGIGCRAVASGTQSVGTSTLVAVVFDTEEFDTDGFHDNATNNTRFTIPAGLGGVYSLTGRASWDSNTSGMRYLWWRKNGNTDIAGSNAGAVANAGLPAVPSTVAVSLSAGDYVELIAYQDSGGARTLSSNVSGDTKWAAAASIMRLDSGSSGIPVGGTAGQTLIKASSDNYDYAWANPVVGFIGTRVYNSAVQSVPEEVTTLLTYDSERYDTDGIHSTSVNTGRLTCPAGMGGKWLVGLYVQFAPDVTPGVAWTYIIPSTGIDTANDARALNADGASQTRVSISSVVTLSAGDYVESKVFHDAGNNLDITAEFWMVKLDSGKVGTGIGARCRHSTTQSLTDATWTSLNFDIEDFDTDGFHSTSANTSRITVPAGLGGKYLLTGLVEFTTNATGTRATRFYKNGTTRIGGEFLIGAVTASLPTRLNPSTVVDLAAGDYVEFQAYQSSGGALNSVNNADFAPMFSLMRLDSGSSGIPSGGTTGQTLIKASGNNYDYAWATSVGQFTVTFDGGGSALTAGTQTDIVAPYSGTITGWTMLADQSGSAVVDIWSDTYGNYPPTNDDSITASAPPTLTTATKAASSTLTGWTTALTAGKVLRFNLDSATTVTRLVLVLDYNR